MANVTIEIEAQNETADEFQQVVNDVKAANAESERATEQANRKRAAEDRNYLRLRERSEKEATAIVEREARQTVAVAQRAARERAAQARFTIRLMQTEERRLQRVAREAERAATQVAAANRGFIQDLTFATARVGRELLAFTQGLVQSSANLETYRATLQAVTQDSAETERILGNLLDLTVELVGIDTGTLIQYAARLQAAGLSAEQAESVIAGVTRRISEQGKGSAVTARVLEQFTQAINSNAISMQDFRPILREYPLLYKDISRALGTNITSLDEFRTAAERVGGATQAIVRTLENTAQVAQGADLSTLNAQLDILEDSARVLAAELGQHLLPAVVSVVKGINSLIQWFTNLNDTAQAAIAWSAALATGFTGLVTVVGTLSIALNAMNGYLAVTTGVTGFAGLGAILSRLPALLNPTVAIIAATATVLGVVGVAIKNAADEQARLRQLPENIRTVIEPLNQAREAAQKLREETERLQDDDRTPLINVQAEEIRGIQAVSDALREWQTELRKLEQLTPRSKDAVTALAEATAFAQQNIAALTAEYRNLTAAFPERIQNVLARQLQTPTTPAFNIPSAPRDVHGNIVVETQQLQQELQRLREEFLAYREVLTRTPEDADLLTQAMARTRTEITHVVNALRQLGETPAISEDLIAPSGQTVSNIEDITQAIDLWQKRVTQLEDSHKRLQAELESGLLGGRRTRTALSASLGTLGEESQIVQNIGRTQRALQAARTELERLRQAQSEIQSQSQQPLLNVKGEQVESIKEIVTAIEEWQKQYKRLQETTPDTIEAQQQLAQTTQFVTQNIQGLTTELAKLVDALPETLDAQLLRLNIEIDTGLTDLTNARTQAAAQDIVSRLEAQINQEAALRREQALQEIQDAEELKTRLTQIELEKQQELTNVRERFQTREQNATEQRNQRLRAQLDAQQRQDRNALRTADTREDAVASVQRLISSLNQETDIRRAHARENIDDAETLKTRLVQIGLEQARELETIQTDYLTRINAIQASTRERQALELDFDIQGGFDALQNAETRDDVDTVTQQLIRLVEQQSDIQRQAATDTIQGQEALRTEMVRIAQEQAIQLTRIREAEAEAQLRITTVYQETYAQLQEAVNKPVFDAVVESFRNQGLSLQEATDEALKYAQVILGNESALAGAIARGKTDIVDILALIDRTRASINAAAADLTELNAEGIGAQPENRFAPRTERTTPLDPEDNAGEFGRRLTAIDEQEQAFEQSLRQQARLYQQFTRTLTSSLTQLVFEHDASFQEIAQAFIRQSTLMIARALLDYNIRKRLDDSLTASILANQERVNTAQQASALTTQASTASGFLGNLPGIGTLGNFLGGGGIALGAASVLFPNEISNLTSGISDTIGNLASTVAELPGRLVGGGEQRVFVQIGENQIREITYIQQELNENDRV